MRAKGQQVRGQSVFRAGSILVYTEGIGRQLAQLIEQLLGILDAAGGVLQNLERVTGTNELFTLAGRSYAIRVGRLQGDAYYVRFESSGAGDKPREKLLAQHVLLIPKAKLEDTLKKRADLLEKKEDTKK